MTLDVREIDPGRYRRVLIPSPGARPRPLCDCDGGHADPQSAADCPLARQAAHSVASRPLLQSILAADKWAPGHS